MQGGLQIPQVTTAQGHELSHPISDGMTPDNQDDMEDRTKSQGSSRGNHVMDTVSSPLTTSTTSSVSASERSSYYQRDNNKRRRYDSSSVSISQDRHLNPVTFNQDSQSLGHITRTDEDEDDLLHKIIEAHNGLSQTDEGSDYRQREEEQIRRNLKSVVKRKVFSTKKFLTDKSLISMEYGKKDRLPDNILGTILIHLNKGNLNMIERIGFWKLWGGEVKKILQELKSNITKDVKTVVLQGKIIFVICFFKLLIID